MRAGVLLLIVIGSANLCAARRVQKISRATDKQQDQLLDVQNTSGEVVDTTETSGEVVDATDRIDPATITAVVGGLETGLKIGGKVYKDIEAETVHEFTTKEPLEVEVLPQGADAFTDMHGWQRKQVEDAQRVLFLHRRNDGYIMPGLVWAEINCKPTWAYGGKYKGKGGYLKNVKLNCKSQVFPRTSVSLTVKTDTPVNTGTPDEPVPEISVIVGIDYKTPTLKKGFKEVQFTFGGDGQFHYSAI